MGIQDSAYADKTTEQVLYELERKTLQAARRVDGRADLAALRAGPGHARLRPSLARPRQQRPCGDGPGGGAGARTRVEGDARRRGPRRGGQRL